MADGLSTLYQDLLGGSYDCVDRIVLKRLGVDVRSLSAREFSLAYLQLARRYHPDRGNQKSHELMANINAARTTILKAYDHGP